MAKEEIMKVGIIQSPVLDGLEDNISLALENLEAVKGMGADIAIYGEMCMAPYDVSLFAAHAQKREDAVWRIMSLAAARLGIYVIVDAVPLLEWDVNGARMFNAAFVFDRNGREIACCKKAHLFDVDINDPELGRQVFRESDVLSAGDGICMFDTEFGRMGLMICFDIRFPEMAQAMALSGARAIFCPAAFSMATGPLSWEGLFCRRAADAQLFTVGVSPSRRTDKDYKGYSPYGHSIVADPWGRVVFQADEKPCVRVVELDFSMVDSVRSQLPLLKARRPDLYLKL